VNHHCQIDVIKVPEPQELGFPAQKLQLAFTGLVYAPGDVAVLFSRDGKGQNAASQVL
jgi:hypothetical protein